MSAKIEVVYRASQRDEISANFSSVSFSTATGLYANNQAWLKKDACLETLVN